MNENLVTVNLPLEGLTALIGLFCLLIIAIVWLVWSLCQLKTKIHKNQAIKKNNQIFKTQEQSENILTNLPTRYDFKQYLEQMLPVALGHDNLIALLIVNIDNFKSINHSLGLTIGDFLLQQVSERIANEVDEKSLMTAHFGGDEFAILLKFHAGNTAFIVSTINRLLQAIRRPFKIFKHDTLISASIGICTFPDCADNAENLLKNADMAMYSAKITGKNTYQFYTKEMSIQSLEKASISGELHKALENNELSLFYQPKICATSGLVMGAEALVRWTHPTKGSISPATFIPIAEESGMILPMGRWILNTACHNLKRIHEEGFPNLTVAINLSAHQFSRGDITVSIAEALWESKLPPISLEVELTESVVMNNPDKSLLMLQVLKAMGIKIAIDDFGTGYSSLSQLCRFPIDTLKIDQSFVRNMYKDAEKSVIVSTIISMAQQLNLKVVAEGVETQEEANFLLKENCDYFQGFFYCKPIALDNFLTYIKGNIREHASF